MAWARERGASRLARRSVGKRTRRDAAATRMRCSAPRPKAHRLAKRVAQPRVVAHRLLRLPGARARARAAAHGQQRVRQGNSRVVVVCAYSLGRHAQRVPSAPLAQHVQRRVASEVVRHVERCERQTCAHGAVQPSSKRRRSRRRLAAAAAAAGRGRGRAARGARLARAAARHEQVRSSAARRGGAHRAAQQGSRRGKERSARSLFGSR